MQPISFSKSVNNNRFDLYDLIVLGEYFVPLSVRYVPFSIRVTIDVKYSMKLTGFASSIILRPKNSKTLFCIVSSDTVLSLFRSRIRSLTNRSISSNLMERMLSSFCKMGARVLNCFFIRYWTLVVLIPVFRDNSF